MKNLFNYAHPIIRRGQLIMFAQRMSNILPGHWPFSEWESTGFIPSNCFHTITYRFTLN